jgi:hypothetical protein
MAEQMVILKNVGDVPLQVTYFHDIVCAHRQICTCQTVDRPGLPPLRLEHSVRIPIKEKTKPLPAAVKLIPQVKSGCARGKLKVLAAPAKVEKV